MEKSPYVSVVIPTYNSVKTITETLESVRNQTYLNYEIIVVDDGSTDGTIDLLEKITDIIFIKQTNQGPSVARNRGVEEAKGDYIAFLDSDDLWHPQKLELLLKIAESLKHFGMIATSYKIIHEIPTNPSFPIYNAPSREIIKELSFYRFFETTFCLPSTVLIPKVVFKEMGGFDPEWKSGQDRDLWLKISYKYPIYYLPLDLTWYYIREGSLSQSIRIIGQINKIFMAEKWNPNKEDTWDVNGQIDYKLYQKIFRKIVIQVGQWILKYRTTACFQKDVIDSYQIFNIYWERFSYIFGKYGFFIKSKIILRNIIKYSFRNIPKQRIDEKLILKLLSTKITINNK